jgi:hypothetical protein
VDPHPLDRASTVLVKSATDRLIAEVGDCRLAAQALGKPKSFGTMSRYSSLQYRDTIPVADAAFLERLAGRPIVTEALAGLAGRALGPAEPEPEGGLLGSHAVLAAEFAAVCAAVAAALADGRVTFAEMNRIIGEAHGVEAATRALRAAAAKAAGRGR